ncbi:hypothetical protein EON68_03440, partial [archaeon]
MLTHSSEQPSAVRRWNEDGSLDAKDSELWVEHSPARVPVSFVVVLTQLPARAQSAWQDSRMERVEHRAATATSGQHTHDPLYYVLGSVVVAPSGHPKSVLAAANAKLRRASSPAHAAAEPVAEADEDEHDLDHVQRAHSSARRAERTSSSAAMVARTRNGRKGKPAADAGVRGEKKTASPEHGAPAAAAHLVGSAAASSQSVAPDASSVISETVSTHG